MDQPNNNPSNRKSLDIHPMSGASADAPPPGSYCSGFDAETGDVINSGETRTG